MSKQKQNLVESQWTNSQIVGDKKTESSNQNQLNYHLEINLQEEFKNLMTRFSSPSNIFAFIWKDEFTDLLNNFVSKIVNTISKSFIDTTTYHNLMAKALHTSKWWKFVERFYEKLDLKTLRNFIDTDLYYKILKHKYSDLDNFIEQFWSQITNVKDDKLQETLKNFSCDCNNSAIYKQMIKLLTENFEVFKKNLQKTKTKFKTKPKNYQILRYIWLKSEEFRKPVLENILTISKYDLKNYYKKFLLIRSKLNNIFNQKVNLSDEVKIKIDDALTRLKSDSNDYFKLENLKKQLKNYKFSDTDYRTYIKQKALSDLKEYVLLDKNTEKLLSQEDYVKLENSVSKSDFNVYSNSLNFQMYEHLFMVKEIILQIQKKLWYAPWIAPIVKQGLSEKINFSDKWFKRFKFLLFFVVAESYSEYKTLFKFFDDAENIYQKNDIYQKITNTLSIFVFWILFLVIVNVYIGSNIYQTFLFVFLSFMVFILYVVLNFNFNFNLNFFSKQSFLQSIWLVIIFLSLAFIFAVLWWFNYFFWVSFLLWMWVLLILIFTVINTYFHSFNLWVYKIGKFVFLLLLLVGFSPNFNTVVYEKMSKILSWGFSDYYVENVLLKPVSSSKSLVEIVKNISPFKEDKENLKQVVKQVNSSVTHKTLKTDLYMKK